MSQGQSSFGRFIDRLVPRNVWVRTLVVLGSVLGGAAFIVIRILDYLDWRPDSKEWLIFGILNVGLYLLVVARTSQKQATSAEHQWYHQTGVLFHGDQANISFRVETFLGVLDGLAKGIGPDKLQESLLNAGRLASMDFATELPEIYDIDVRIVKQGAPWDLLTLDEKLSEWADYDSGTGWGSIRTQLGNGDASVSITHNKGLFTGSSGKHFSYFLAGYCETVLTKIVDKHEDGKHGRFAEASISNISTQKNEVQIRFSWV